MGLSLGDGDGSDVGLLDGLSDGDGEGSFVGAGVSMNIVGTAVGGGS